tara:strand:+ start:1489 stop:2523 length:1035 start_codon:yes stop_codon:yes gene_type:complete
MSKVLRVTDGNYRIAVDNGDTGTIFLDTTTGAASPRGTVVITGDLEVKGTTTEVESTVTTIADNILTLNEGEAGAGIRASFDYKAGIEIDRGSLPTARLIFDEQSPYVAGGSSGTGSFRFEDINGAFLPLNVNSINAEGPLYVTTPNSAINVAGTVDYEENVFNYSGGVVTDPGGGNVVLNNDFIPNAKGVVDYVTFALATNFQPGIQDADTSVTTSDFDTSTNESRVIVTVDGVVTTNFYSNRIELGDIKIQDNEISTLNSNESLLLSAPGTGSVTVKDALEITEHLYDDDGIIPSSVAPETGIKLFSSDESYGDTGLFFVNKSSTTGEMISKNRALLFSMLF